MAKVNDDVKPYFLRVRDWKIRNIVMMYFEARERFMSCRRIFRKDLSLSFEKLKEISDILFEIKEAHHLIFKRVIDPEKGRYDKSRKISPDEIETEFMNNIGLLFHKIMVTRELKYLMDHYVEDIEAFQRNNENLQYNLNRIDELFIRGIEIIKSLLGRYKNNILLLTYLLEDPARIKKHLGQDVIDLLDKFVDGRGLDEVYYSVGKYYSENGWTDKARKMLKEAVRRNPRHPHASAALTKLE
ncbi:MAG TPA: hypothetical protein VGA99_10790 [bacterium]